MQNDKAPSAIRPEALPDHFFNSRVERIEDYERFYFAKNLLKNRYHDFIMNLDHDKALQKFDEFPELNNDSISDFQKLIQRIEKWNNLIVPVPLRYLDFIGLKISTLYASLNLDMEAFRQTMKLPFFPEYFVVETAENSLKINLPAGTGEKKAICIARAWDRKKPYIEKYIGVEGLKKIIIQLDGHSYMVSYPPIVIRKKDLLIPS
jgi:hypothetical protein